MLGPDCALVFRTLRGFRSVERDHAMALQKCAFAEGRDRDLLFRQSQRIAEALNKGEIALAQIHGLYIPVAELDDRRLTRISQIRFAKDYNPDEPRVPKGDPHGGEWTAGGAAVGSATLGVPNSGDSTTTAPDSTTTPGIYAVTAQGGNSPEPTENGDSSSSSSADPPMKFEFGPPVSTPPAPPPHGDGDTRPSTLGSDDLGGTSTGGAATTETPDQSDSSASENPQSDLGPAPPPEIPDEQPATTQQINTVLRNLATWLSLARAMLGVAYELDPEVALVLAAIEATIWLADYAPKVWSYLDAPQTLADLQNAATRPAPPGYELHHIVEAQKRSEDAESNARRFSDRIDSRENLVRVPYWKHIEISSWYSRSHREYGGLTLRTYLRGKSWQEQYDIGLEVLRRHGVLK